ncbi:MAG TPA: DUF1028 domain-containing protein [Anaerolineales bacterium]|nr:DUF1028 domain-containing protein [Anaerolineales bacterium]
MKGRPFSTYSIVARDPDTGDLGVAVQTHQMAVGWVVPWLLPGYGALATQSLVNISLGPMGLAMLREGVPAPDVVRGLIGSDPRPDGRQLAVVDSEGRVGAWTGPGCIPQAGHHTGDGYSVQANMMEKSTVIPAMQEAYERASGRFIDRLLAALIAAEAEGGDIRGSQSAAVKIVVGDPIRAAGLKTWETIYDLRVDEHSDPVGELSRLARLRTSQLISDEGEEALKAGDLDRGLELWKQARQNAPELEETGFWQAMILADNYDDVNRAAEILHEVFRNDSRRSQWLDLIARIQACGLLEREGVAESLLSTLEGYDD